MFHITFHITRRYIPPLVTSRTTPPPLPCIAPCHSPHSRYLIPHRTTFHIPCHRTRTNPYYTTTFNNPIPLSLRDSELYVIRFVTFLYATYPTPTQKWWKSVTSVIHKVLEKVIPVCPPTWSTPSERFGYTNQTPSTSLRHPSFNHCRI